MSLSVALGITLEDDVSGRNANRLVNSIKSINEAGKAAAQGLSNSFKRGFSIQNIDLALRENERKLNASKQRLTQALAMAATIAVPVTLAANFEDELVDFMKVAELPLEQMAAVESRLVAATKKTGKSKTELLEAVAAYVGKGLDLDRAFGALEATGRTATATGATVADMSASGFAVMDNMKVSAKDLEQAFNIMAVSGKEGSFELQAMARKFPEITAGAKSLKMEGVSAVASLAAALQIAMKSAGSEDQAATNFSNLLGKITAPDTVKKFKKMGVNLEKEMKIAEEKSLDVLDHMLGIISEKTGGDAFKMGALFQDKQVLDFLKAIIPNLEEFRRIRDKAANGPDIISKDFATEAFNAKFGLKGLRIELDNLLGSSGALLPIIKSLTAETTAIVANVGNWAAANPELTATIIKGTAAALALGIATRVGAFAFYSIRGAVISTVAAFFKFNDAGRNVSIVAKSIGLASTLIRLSFAAISLARTGLAAVLMGTAGGVAAFIAGITAPIWAIAGAVTLVVAGVAAAVVRYWEPIKSFTTGFTSVISSELGTLYNSVSGFIGNVAQDVGSKTSTAIIDFASWIGIDENSTKQVLASVAAFHVDVGNEIVSFVSSLPRVRTY